MKKLLLLFNTQIVLLGLFLISSLSWGQATAPASFDFTAGSSFTFTSLTGTTLPSNITVGTISSTATGVFITDLTADAANGTAANTWNAQGPNGISFLGGSNNRRGSFLFRGNTTGRNNIVVAWTARTILNQANNNYIALQWRNGTTGDWNNVTGVTTAGVYPFVGGDITASTSYSVTLPSAADNLADLRIRWIYYEDSTGGARDRLAIDEITVSSSAISTTTPSLAITGTLAHGLSCVGAPATAINYTITNTGTLAEGITVVSSNPEFVVSGLSATTILASGGTATYNVTFTPASVGAKTATITVASTTSGSNSPTSSLTGSGINTPPTVTTPTSAAITTATATLGGNVTALGCSTVTTRGIEYSTTDGFANGTGTVVSETAASYATGTFTIPVSGLNAGTLYYYKAFATSTSGTAYSAQGSFTTSFLEPSNHPTNFAATAVTVNNIVPTWIASVPGTQAPDGYLIKASNTTVTTVTDPVDGVDPGTSGNFAGGVASAKITPGTATTAATFSSMQNGIMYNYKIYPYAGSGAGINYKIAGAAEFSHATLPPRPTALTSSNVLANSATISWTLGTHPVGNKILVFVKAGSAVTLGTPTNAPSTYTENTIFGSGTPFQNDAAAFCVYKGDGSSVNITGLNPSTTYNVAIYRVVEASNSNGTNSYSQVSTGNFITSPVLVITGSSTFSSICPTFSTAPLTFTITNNGATTVNGIAVNSANTEFAVSNLSSTTIAPLGTATYQVIFTPATAGNTSALITVSSSNAASATNTVSGSGTATTAPTVSTNAATLVTAKTATLNGNVTNVGVCPAITERGFVYSISSVDSTPTEGESGVIKQVVAGTSTGAYTFGLTNLPSSTQYSFRSYVFDGTTYVYGVVRTFTTSAALVLSGTLAHGTICPTLSTAPITYTITNNGATAADGIVVSSANTEFAVSNLSSTTIAPSGTATYQVTFTPATSGDKNALITVSSSTAASASNTVTGTGTTIVAQAVATNTANTITVNSANLRATSSTFGICPATSAKGFVYSITSLNNDPLIGGSNVSNASVTLGTQGAFNQTVSGLSPGVNYSYKAYLFNGTSYTYGAVQTFTTLAPPTNDNCSGATPIVLNAAAITGDLANATQSLPAITCSTVTGNADDDVWYSFTTSAAGNYTITADDGAATLDLVLDIRSGGCDGTNFACMDDTVSDIETITLSLLASTTYYVRVYDYDALTSLTLTTFTIQVTTVPELSNNGTSSLSFANQHITSNSASQTFNVSGQFLTGSPGVVTVASSTTDFQVSTDNLVWNSSVTLPYTTDQLASVPVYVRFTPQSTGAKTANITLSGGGATAVNVAVNGLGIFVATAATNITPTSFDANWQVVANASSGYLLDVSTSPTFGNASILLNQGFEVATFPPTNWTSVGWARSINAADIKTGSGAAIANANNGSLTSPAVANPTSMTFFLGRSNNTTAKTLTIEVSTTSQSTGFSTVATYNHGNVPESTYNQYTVDLSAFSSQPTVFIRFTKTSGTTSPWRLDDIVVNAGAGSFIAGYNAKPIAGQATVTTNVEGLAPETQYYYRLRAVNGSVESGNSNTISVLTLAPITSTTWTITAPAVTPAWTNAAPTASLDAIIEANYDEAPSITAKNLTVNAAAVLTVRPTQTLTVAGNLTNNGSIIFKSDATGTARFAPYTGAAIAGTGTATVERFIPSRRAWRILTAPLTGITNNTISANWQGTNGEGVLLFSPAVVQSQTMVGYTTGGTAPNIRKYNAGWVNITNLTTEPMFGATPTETKPFLVFPTGPVGSTNIITGADATTLRPKGQLITGTVSHSGLATGTFHALANPYASAINPTSLLGNPANLGQKIWVIRSSIGSFGAYVTFDGTDWSLPPNTTIPAPANNDSFIQSGQGFFVRSATASSFTITENDKVAGSSTYWLQKNASETSDVATADRIRVLLYKQIDNNWNLADGTLAVNYPSGSNTVDAMDSNKISNFNESIMFRNGTTSLSIEHRALPVATETQDLRITNTTVLPYQLRLYTENYSNSSLLPILEDTVNGTFTAIPTNGTEVVIPFTGVAATTTNPDNRFRIVYQTNLSNVEQSPLVASVFPNPVVNNELNVHLGAAATNAEYSITNMLGQFIQKGTLMNTQNKITLSGASQGFYILSIRQDGKSFTTKIYVQ